LKTVPMSSVEPSLAESRREKIMASSRERYARSREEVEALIRASHDAQEEGSRNVQKRTKTRMEIPLSAANEPQATQTQELARFAQTPGRGGEHHKYLQQLVKRWAEGRGYSVTLERPVLDGLGSVDVALEKEGRPPIACEISVTTNVEHEIGNVQKCLAAGFAEVLLISSEKKTLTSVRHALVVALSTAQYRQVKFFTPEETFSYLDGLRAEASPARASSPDPSELLTAKEVEELLRIDVKTVYSYVQRGLLPYVRIQSNLRFLRSEIVKWMEERKYKPGNRSMK
jgi:excisionase family DNA binding protein